MHKIMHHWVSSAFEENGFALFLHHDGSHSELIHIVKPSHLVVDRKGFSRTVEHIWNFPKCIEIVTVAESLSFDYLASRTSWSWLIPARAEDLRLPTGACAEVNLNRDWACHKKRWARPDPPFSSWRDDARKTSYYFFTSSILTSK